MSIDYYTRLLLLSASRQAEAEAEPNPEVQSESLLSVMGFAQSTRQSVTSPSAITKRVNPKIRKPRYPKQSERCQEIRIMCDARDLSRDIALQCVKRLGHRTGHDYHNPDSEKVSRDGKERDELDIF